MSDVASPSEAEIEADWCYRLPASQCYWAQLDADVGEKHIPFQFENSLPVAVESLYVASLRLKDSSWIVCGMPRTVIDAYLKVDPQRAEQIWSITPADVPEFLKETVTIGDLHELNILSGEQCAAAKQRWQYTSLYTLTGILLMITVLMWIGVENRVQQAHSDADALSQRRVQLLQEYYPGFSQSTSLYTQLEQDLRRLRQQAGGGDPSQQQAYASLANVLMQQWPAEMVVSVESVTFQGDRLAIRGQAKSMEEAQQLWQALKKLDVLGTKWLSSPLQAQQQQSRVVFQLSFKPQKPVAGASS